MPAFAGEPFRGMAKVQLDEALADLDFTLTFTDVNPTAAPADQATWEGSQGSTLTLFWEWAETGAAVNGAPESVTVEVRLPAGAIVGSAWTFANPPANVAQTRTFHFDDDPLNQAAGAARAGALELYFRVSNNNVGESYDVDTRGTVVVAPAAGTTFNFARGYARSRALIASHRLSIASPSIAAEPTSWAFPYPVHSRISLGTLYRSALSTTRLNRGGGGATERSGSTSSASGDREQQWTGTSGLNRRIGNGMFLGSEAKDLQLEWAAAPLFGTEADHEFVFSAAGHEAGWAISGSDRIATRANRITVDPRISVAPHLLQINSSTFQTPPTAGDAPGHDRLSSELGFAAARHRNALSEGLDSDGSIGNAGGTSTSVIVSTLTLTDRLRDVGNLGSVNDITGLTTATRGGESGWSSFHAWPDQLPTGDWNHTMIITAAEDAVGLESGATAADFTLIGQDLAVRLVPFFAKSTGEADHFAPGDAVEAGLMVLSVTTGARLAPSLITDPKVALFRYRALDDRVEMLAADEVTWSPWGPVDTVVFHAFAISANDARFYVRTFSSTATWTADAFGMFFAKANGVPVFGSTSLERTGAENRHSGYAVDAFGLALAGVLSQR